MKTQQTINELRAVNEKRIENNEEGSVINTMATGSIFTLNVVEERLKNGKTLETVINNLKELNQQRIDNNEEGSTINRMSVGGFFTLENIQNKL